MQITQPLQNVGTQIVAYQIRIPDDTIEQALHSIGAAFSSVFGQLPAVFALDGTHDPFERGQATATGAPGGQNEGQCGHGGVRVLAPTARLRQKWFWLPSGKAVEVAPCLFPFP